MPTQSNWPAGVDLSHPNYTLRTPRTSRYDGMGGWKKDSTRIPFWPAVGFTACGMVFVWALLKLPLLIWG